MSETDVSRYMSLILRHKPSVIGIELDEHGWANVEELMNGINRTKELASPLDRTRLEIIVAEDNKQRYSFNEDKTLIRANQGHSIPVDVELKKKSPPDILWHGTGEKFTASIDQTGLISKSRLYVHLSADLKTAVTVGSRHGKPVVYTVDTQKMQTDGYDFYQSVNGVWLTKRVPVEYLTKIQNEKG